VENSIVCMKHVLGLEINERDRKIGWDSASDSFRLVDVDSLHLLVCDPLPL
jgi:hypothetical protein